MKHLCLFEDDQTDHLRPLIQTRSPYQLRVGARSLLYRMGIYFPQAHFILHTRKHLASFLRQQTSHLVNEVPAGTGVLFVNGRIVTLSNSLRDRLQQAARQGEPDCLFFQGDDLIAAWISQGNDELVKSDIVEASLFGDTKVEEVEGAELICRLWHILDRLHPALLDDLEYMLQSNPRTNSDDQTVSPHATFLNPSDIYLAPGVRIRAGAILDAHTGPIVLDRGAEIMEHSIVRGPVYIGPGSTLKARSEIEGSGVGPVCKVAGEVMDVVFQSYSNKAHQGFMGHSYLGSWCNMGAGSISSNLRNDYGGVSLYNEYLEAFEDTNRQFLGLFMADHSKCGIQSMFNTGSVIGVFCNLYGSGFIPRYVPSFSWGNADGDFELYRIQKALEVARRVMGRRRLELSDEEAELLTRIYNERHAHTR